MPAPAAIEPLPAWKRGLPWIAAILSFLVFLPIYWTVAQKRIALFNSNIEKTAEIDGKSVPIIFHYDQHVYLNTGRLMRRANYDWFVPRHRTPGYPFLLSFFYDEANEYTPGKDDPRHVSDDYFEKGKQFNVIASMICIGAIFVFLATQFSVWLSLLVTWSIAWFQFVFRAPFTQPEVLFATLSFVSFVMLAQQIMKPRWKRGIVVGVLLAAAFMLKAAILPLVALFVACFALKYLVRLLQQFRAGELDWSAWLLDVSKGVVVPLLFVTLLSPYLLETWKKYGNPFWNVHSQHFMWLESKEDKHQWRHLLEIIDEEGAAPEDAPSRERYFRNHTVIDFLRRGLIGANASIDRIGRDYRDAYRFLMKRLLYVAGIVAIVALLASFPAIRKKFLSPDSPSLKAAAQEYWILVPYFGLFIFGYLTLYGSYHLIGAGPRLVISMFPAVLFSIWVFVEKFAPVLYFAKWDRMISTRLIFRGILAICLILGIVNTLQNEVNQATGGN